MIVCSVDVVLSCGLPLCLVVLCVLPLWRSCSLVVLCVVLCMMCGGLLFARICFAFVLAVCLLFIGCLIDGLLCLLLLCVLCAPFVLACCLIPA